MVSHPRGAKMEVGQHAVVASLRIPMKTLEVVDKGREEGRLGEDHE